jgi:Holliday junction resolvase RusA-like endonuclease
MPKMYVIEGNPIPWARTGFNKSTLYIYDRQREERVHAKLNLENQHGDEKLYRGILAMYIDFYLPTPKSYSQKKRVELENTFHHSRPDLDNLLKWVCDISTEVLFQDDALIAQISARKLYSVNPRTTFTVLEMNE